MNHQSPNDPVRIRDDGRPEDRALLNEAGPPVPPGLQQQLRFRLESHLSAAPVRARKRRLRALWAGVALLTAGSAFALTTPSARRALRELTGWTTDRTPHEAPRPPTGPHWRPLPHRPVAPPDQPSVLRDPASPPPATRPAPAAAVSQAGRPPVQHPELRFPPGEFPLGAGSGTGLEDGTTAPASSVRQVAPPLRIQRQGRTAAQLRADGQAVRGRFRGADVTLRLEGSLLTGSIGGQPVSLFLQQRLARGTIAGADLSFELALTETGAIVRGWVPNHTVRVELKRDTLMIHPGCDEPLSRQGPGTYQGRCGDGKSLSVTLPPAFETMPLFPRLLILGVLLTERDPLLGPENPQLFSDETP